MLAHEATHEARTAAEVIGRAVVFEPRAVPALAFTDPEGMTKLVLEPESGWRRVTGETLQPGAPPAPPRPAAPPRGTARGWS
jgi:hypothetical protein